MFELNLIKEKVKFIKKRSAFYQYFIFVYGFIFVVCLLMAVKFTLASYRISVLRKDLKKVEESIVASKKMIGIDKIEQEWLGYYDDLCRIQDHFGSRTLWGRRLQAISNILPEGLCVGSIDISDMNGEETMSMNLIAYPKEKSAFEIVDQFMNSIENNKYFEKKVRLESQEKRTIKGKDVEMFRISIPFV